MHTPETAALVARASQGDHPAVEDLLIAHLPQLRAYVRLHSDNLVRDRESCSDLVQSVCREVLQDMRGFEFQGEAPFRKWLFQKALSKIVDRKRRWLTDKRDPAREATLDTTQVKGVYASFCTPSQVAIGNEAMERLERAFDELPGDYQQVITLHRLIGLSHAEIASEMDRGEGAVRALLNRALVRLGIVMTRR